MEGMVLPAAVRVAVGLIPLVGRRIVKKARQREIAATATSALVADQAERFIEQLDESQIRRLQEFVGSPQFGHLMLQTMLYSLAGMKDEDTSAIRDQMRASLKHGGIFADADLLQATDVLVELLHSSVHSVRGAAGATLDHGYAIAIAAQVATAGARNSALLQQVATLNEYRAFATKLRSQVRALHGKLRLAQLGQARSVDYSQLYVTPTLRDAASSGESYPFETIVTQRLRSVILGDPGAGKSTLASKLAHDLADNKIAGLEGQVPLMLVVREHTAGIRSEHETLVHYLEAACRRPYGQPAPAQALEYLLLNGLATVIIDGLDELGDSHFRAGFAQMVDAFCYLYPLARVVITSRVIGYEEAPVDDALFETTLVAPFDDRQVGRYVGQWFGLDPSLPGERQGALREAFMRESAEASDLRANPLMLSLLCVLYSSERFIPQNRPGVYEKCAELLFDTWDRSRGIDVPHNFRQYVRPAVQQLAWRIFTDAEARLALPRAEMEEFLATSVLAKRFDRPEDAMQAAHDFLQFCTGRAWVLTDIASDVLEPHYGFVHKTFLEYFAAAQLVKQKPDPQAVWEKISPHIDGGAWEVVSQVAVQILDRDCQNGADDLLRLVLAEVQRRQGDYPKRPAALLQFAGRCLETVAPDGDVIRLLARRAVALAAVTPAATRRRIGPPGPELSRLAVVDSPLYTLLSVRAAENIQRVARCIADAIWDLAQSQPEDSSAGMIYQLCLRSARPWGAVLHPVGEALSNELAARPVPAAAQLWHRIMFAPSAEDIHQRGLGLLYEPSVLHPLRLDSFAHRLLVGSVLDYMPERAWMGNVPMLESLYEAVASIPQLTDVAVHAPDWQSLVAGISVAALDRLTPTARATALLLLVPVFHIVRSVHTRDEQIRWLATARVETSRREAAVDLINGWRLPNVAHDRLVDWIQGR